MATIRAKLTKTHLNAAREMVANGIGDGTIFADDKTDGLVLRVRRTAAAFSLKYAGNTRLLGPLSPNAKGKPEPGEIQTIEAARELAAKVRALMKDGTDPRAFLSGKAAEKSDTDSENAAAKQTLVKAGQWTWETLVIEYADKYLSQPRVVKKRLRQPSLKSAETARKSLMPPEANCLKGKLLSELSIGDLEEVRDLCADADRKTASRAFVANAKAALSFAKKTYARKSGLEHSVRWWLALAALHATAVVPRTRLPSLAALSRTLYIAEKHRVIEGRKVRRQTSETTLCAMWWIAIAAQRSEAAMSLERAHVLPWPVDHGTADGWKVVSWAEADMKSRRFHSLPIPPRAVLLIERSIATGRGGSKYVFPATALRKGVEDAHIDKNSFKNVIERLRGRRKHPKGGKANEEDGRDLLEGMPHFSPHDIRRAFATTCSDLKVRGDAISAVLDHAGIEDEIGQKVFRSAEITRLAYDYSQRLSLKREAMEAWANRLFAECDKVWKSNRPRLRNPVPPSLPGEKLTFSDNAPWYVLMEEQKKRKPKPRLDLSKFKNQAILQELSEDDSK